MYYAQIAQARKENEKKRERNLSFGDRAIASLHEYIKLRIPSLIFKTKSTYFKYFFKKNTFF